MRIVPVSVAANGTLSTESRHVTVTKIDTGQYGLSLNKSFQSDMFVFPITRTDGVARHIAQVPKANLSNKTARVYTYDLSDVAADAPFDALLIGSDGLGPQFQVVPNLVYCALRKPRMIPFYYDGANDALHSKNRWDGAVTKTGTGAYTLTLKWKFQQTPYVVAVTSSTTRHVEVHTKTNGVITFQVFNSTTGVAADSELFIIVMGSDARQIYSRGEEQLRAPQPFTFLNPFEYNGVGGSPAMVRGGASFTAVDNGTGDYSFTRRKTYPKAGFALAAGGGAAVVAAVSNRTYAGFKITAEADAVVYGLDVGYARGRDSV